MLLSYLIENKADKKKLVMKLKQLESSMSSGRKSKYPVSRGIRPSSLAPSSKTAPGLVFSVVNLPLATKPLLVYLQNCQ